MSTRITYKPRVRVLSFLVCFVAFVGACFVAYVVLGGSIDKMFSGLADAVSRAN